VAVYGIAPAVGVLLGEPISGESLLFVGGWTATAAAVAAWVVARRRRRTQRMLALLVPTAGLLGRADVGATCGSPLRR
jgi:hypothetical protein